MSVIRIISCKFGEFHANNQSADNKPKKTN